MPRPICPKTYNHYGNDPKFSDRQVWLNSADPDQTALDQGLHSLPFRLHNLDALLYGIATLFKFSSDYSTFLGCPNIFYFDSTHP